MSRQIRLDIAPATATHCGENGKDCQYLRLGWVCDWFGYLRRDPERETAHRLPECLAAEKEASE